MQLPVCDALVLVNGGDEVVVVVVERKEEEEESHTPSLVHNLA